jgi:hypothetical protein
MRALCGAIITAGALIGLGLTATAFGTRYNQQFTVNKDTNQLEMVHIEKLSDMDKPLLFILVFLTAVADFDPGSRLSPSSSPPRIAASQGSDGITGSAPRAALIK